MIHAEDVKPLLRKLGSRESLVYYQCAMDKAQDDFITKYRNELEPSPLEESIKHWQRLASGNRLEKEAFGSDDCALCDAYLNLSNGPPCINCPIRIKTGKTLCEDTPFDFIRELEMTSIGSIEKLMDSQEFKDVAQKELDFLISLRPSFTVTPIKG